MSFSISRAMSGAGSAVSEVAGDYAKTAIQKNAQIDLLKIKADIDSQRDARLNDYAVTMERDVKQPFQSSERQAGQEFAGKENQANRDSQQSLQTQRLAVEQMMHGDRMQIENKRVDLEGKRVGLEGARLKNDSERLGMERQVKDLQIAAARLDLDDKKRLDSLRKAYVDPETDDKTRQRIADSITTLLGKDKYTPLVGKDDQGNAQYIGAFDTRNGEVKNGASTKGIVDPFKAAGSPTASASSSTAKPRAAPEPAPRSGIVASAIGVSSQQNSAFSTAEQLSQKEYGISDEKLGGILQALDAPNLNVQQKSTLSMQLQGRLRELGKMGQ